MQVLKRVTSSLVIVLLLPVFAQAVFGVVSNQLIVGTDTSLYRLKNNRLWQLSTFVPEKVIQQLTLNDQQYVITQSVDGEQLFVSTDGLRYQQIELPVVTNLMATSVHNQLFITALDGDSLHSYQLDSAGHVTVLSDIAESSPAEIRGIISSNGTTLLLIQRLNSFESYLLTATTWTLADSVSCQNFKLYTTPIPAIFCPDSRQLLSPSAAGHWQPFIDSAVTAVGSDQLLVGVAADQSSVYVTDGQLITNVLYDQSLIGAINAVEVYGSRVFIRSAHLYELQWSGDVGFSLINADPATTIVPERNDTAVYILGSQVMYSKSSTSSSLVAVPGPFDRAMNVSSGGHLVWKNGGSLTAYAGADLVYQVVPTGWATNSQITDVTQTNGKTYLLLINGSKNYNLYSTTSFDKWTKITLPTHATTPVTIGQARTLPAGSLIEATGTISTPPGIVADNILYIQDQLAGIQVYLSTAKGSLPKAVGKTVIVTGEISASAAKRILLDQPADIEVIGVGSVQPVAVSPDVLDNYVGRLVSLRSRISSLTKDYFTFGSVKIHATLDSNTFTEGSLISSPVIVDYNSATDQVEGWQTASPELIESATPAPTTPPALKLGTTTSIDKTKSVVKASTTTVPTDIAVAATNPSQATLVSAAKSLSDTATGAPDQVQTTILLSALSFLAGTLITTGRRFRRIR